MLNSMERENGAILRKFCSKSISKCSLSRLIKCITQNICDILSKN